MAQDRGGVVVVVVGVEAGGIGAGHSKLDINYKEMLSKMANVADSVGMDVLVYEEEEQHEEEVYRGNGMVDMMTDRATKEDSVEGLGAMVGMDTEVVV